MAALTADRNTTERYRQRRVSYKVAAGAKIYSGSLVTLNATGFAVPAAATANFTVVGQADEHVDNTGGADGDKRVEVARGSFLWNNAATLAVTQADVGKKAYVADDNTVRLFDAGAGAVNIEAGVIDEVDSRGVWVTTL